VTHKTAASRYARALFDVALREKADLDGVETALASFVDLFPQHPPLAKVLLNPAVPVQRKRAAVGDLATRLGLPSMVAKLLALLADRDRLIILPDLVTAYRERVMTYRKVVRADVTTAMPLSPDKTQALERSLAAVTGRTVSMHARVDPSIIGGIVAKVGSTVYDASVTRQLQRMKDRLAERV